MAEETKIIFAGPCGVGKTSAISVVTDGKAKSAKNTSGDANAELATDYGTLKLGEDQELHLYGTPCKKEYESMWKILAQGSIGLVLIMDNRNEDPLTEMEYFLRAFKELVYEREVVIGVTRMDKHPRPGLYSYYTKLTEIGVRAPVFEIDCRNKDDVKALLLALMAMSNPILTQGNAEQPPQQENQQPDQPDNQQTS